MDIFTISGLRKILDIEDINFKKKDKKSEMILLLNKNRVEIPSYLEILIKEKNWDYFTALGLEEIIKTRLEANSLGRHKKGKKLKRNEMIKMINEMIDFDNDSNILLKDTVMIEEMLDIDKEPIILLKDTFYQIMLR